VEPSRVRLRRLTLRLPHWPETLDGLRVAVVSDLHAGGPHVGEERVEHVVARVNREQPDLVALLGDYVDRNVRLGEEVAPEAVAERLGDLRAPLGVFAVLGNHDWVSGGERMRRSLRECGIEVLENDAVSAQRGGEVLWIVGLADLRERHPDTDTPFALVPDGAPLLVLSHDPDLFPHIPARAALTLAGHTHGGQVNIPLVRRLIIPSRYVAGVVEEDGKRMFITRGVGEVNLPLRLGAPPEVAILTLAGS
jgi:predicted MPP superfamily phosphohydrolase